MRDRVLNWIGELAWRQPILIIALATVLAGSSVFYANRTIKLNANTDDLIAPDRPYMKQYRAFLDEFGDLEFMYVVVENSTRPNSSDSAPQSEPSRVETVVEALDARLRMIADLPAVFSAIEPAEQLRIATRARKSAVDPAPALPDDVLKNLTNAADGVATLMSAQSAAPVVARANQLLAQLIREGSSMTAQEQLRTGASATFLLNAVAAANEHAKAQRDFEQFMAGNLKREYFTSPSGRFYFIMIMPAKDYSSLSVIEEPLAKIRNVIEQVKKEFPDVNIGLTGKPVLQADEMATSNDDMTKASVLAFVLCAMCFVLMIGGILRPMLAMFAFLIGSAWTYGAAAFIVGQLNLLSIVFMLVLIGVAFDYGVHVISRYKEHRATNSVHDSIVGAVITAVRGNITGAFTSSTVFFMALFTSFQGLRELGVIAGIGLLLCLIAISLVLPAMLALIDRRKSTPGISASNDARPAIDGDVRSGILGFAIRRSSLVLGIALLMTVALAVFTGGLRFEFNLLELQARGLESVEWEHRILEDSTSASWFGAAVADSPDEARDLVSRAQKQPAIGVVHSVFDAVSTQRLLQPEIREQLQQAIADATNQNPSIEQATWNVQDLQQAIESLNVMAIGASTQSQEAAQELRGISSDLIGLVDQLKANGDETRARIDTTLLQIGQGLRHVIEGNQLSLREALPDAVAQQYMSPHGRYLVAMHPKENVWEYEPMRQFIAQLREIDPQITGAPITHFESLGEMQRSFMIMSILALAVIVVIVWLDFRDWRDVVLALTPLLLSLAWTAGLMGLFDISFNLANFFSVPILIGLGVDASVHVLHRYHEGGPTRLSLGATRRAVILTALTTIIGFGCLLIAQHRGLRSLGLVMSIGSTCGLIASAFVLPTLLVWLERHGRRSPDVVAVERGRVV
jgi:uncharacterized protein